MTIGAMQPVSVQRVSQRAESALNYDKLPEPGAVIDELERDGFACLEGVVREDWLAAARSHITQLIEAEGAKYFSIIRPADEELSPAETIVRDPRLTSLLRIATDTVCPRGVVDYEEVYNVLRIISGPNGGSGSLAFHYDASVITALVPLFIPKSERMSSGELLVMANRRPFRRLLVHNLLEKAALQNRFASKVAASAVRKHPEQFVRDLVPGNIYLFWGYRSYHANFPCAPNALRATLLLHYGNPHGRSKLLKHLRNGRAAFERFRRASN